MAVQTHTHFTNYETPRDCYVRTSRTKPNYLQAGHRARFLYPIHGPRCFFLSPLLGPGRIRVIAKCGIVCTRLFRNWEPAPSCIGQIEFILFEGVPQIEQRSNDFPFSLCGVYGVFIGCTCFPAAAVTSMHAMYIYIYTYIAI